jgi:hypothetical protein
MAVYANRKLLFIVSNPSEGVANKTEYFRLLVVEFGLL